MKKLFLAVCVVSVCLPLVVSGQDAAQQLKDFTWVLPGDVPLGLVYLNDRTVTALFQPPTLYSMRARAHTNTMLYIQGMPERDVQIDTTNFVIEQNGTTLTSVPTNIKHFEKGKAAVAKGERIDGLLTFDKLVNVSQPFTVKHGKDSVQIKFSSDQLKAAAPAAQP